jgi:hypothetical protein
VRRKDDVRGYGSKEVTKGRLTDRTRGAPPTPLFFISVASTGVAVVMSVSADFKGLKVSDFSVSWKWLVSADSKGVMVSFCKKLTNAASKRLSDAQAPGAGW